MKRIVIEKSLQKALSYTEYRTLLKKSLLTKTKQEIENDVFLGYTLLNDKRMDRLDKTLKLSEETINSIQNLTSSFSFLVITEGWCGDSAQVLPILNKIATFSSNIDFKIVFRDENEDLMNQFLTKGSKSIPKVIIVDANNKVINSWGPRPSIATKMVLDYKEKNGVIDAEFKKDLQLWYNKDKGHNTESDILKLLKAS